MHLSCLDEGIHPFNRYLLNKTLGQALCWVLSEYQHMKKTKAQSMQALNKSKKRPSQVPEGVVFAVGIFLTSGPVL